MPCRRERKLRSLQTLVGRLIWIARTARPDISQAVSAYGSRILTWADDVDREMKLSMGFLKLTAASELEFYWPRSATFGTPAFREMARAEVHSDADWTVPRSQSGFFACVTAVPDASSPDDVSGLLPLHHGSQKQPIAGDSSAATEIIAAHHAVRRVGPYMTGVSGLLGLNWSLRVDNSTALKHISTSPSVAWWLYSKALGVRTSLLSELCRVGIFSVSHVPSAVNRADVMTKPLVGGKLRVAMMLASVTSGPELLVGFEGAVARAPFWAHVARATWVFRE